jgi:hypothetical protein
MYVFLDPQSPSSESSLVLDCVLLLFPLVSYSEGNHMQNPINNISYSKNISLLKHSHSPKYEGQCTVDLGARRNVSLVHHQSDNHRRREIQINQTAKVWWELTLQFIVPVILDQVSRRPFLPKKR